MRHKFTVIDITLGPGLKLLQHNTRTLSVHLCIFIMVPTYVTAVTQFKKSISQLYYIAASCYL